MRSRKLCHVGSILKELSVASQNRHSFAKVMRLSSAADNTTTCWIFCPTARWCLFVAMEET